MQLEKNATVNAVFNMAFLFSGHQEVQGQTDPVIRGSSGTKAAIFEAKFSFHVFILMDHQILIVKILFQTIFDCPWLKEHLNIMQIAKF